MKKFILILLVVILSSVLFSCQKNKTEAVNKTSETQATPEVISAKDTVATAKTPPAREYLSSVDASKINTFKDYQEEKSLLWNEYSDAKSKAWAECKSKTSLVWEEYSAKRDSAVSHIRLTNKELYFEWLDVEKMRKHERRMAIENLPEFKEYQVAEKFYLEVYKKADADNYKEFKKIDDMVYREFKMKEDYAYQVFKRKDN